MVDNCVKTHSAVLEIGALTLGTSHALVESAIKHSGMLHI